MLRVGFEPAIPATKRPQTYALDRAATGIYKKTSSATNANNVARLHSQLLLHSSFDVRNNTMSVHH
jgi:hypothetical protein